MIAGFIVLGIVLVAVGMVAVTNQLGSEADQEEAVTADWREAETTLHGGQMEKCDKYHWYPVFAFSYAVGGEYLSGEFGLEIEGDQAHNLIKKLVGSKLAINYDPKQLSSWHIPQETMEGCKVLFRGP